MLNAQQHGNQQLNERLKGNNMRLPQKDSATYRAIITGVQTLLGFIVAAMAMPEFRELVLRWYPAALPILVSVASLSSFVLNYFRSSVKNY
jgi:hypothetical protein